MSAAAPWPRSRTLSCHLSLQRGTCRARLSEDRLSGCLCSLLFPDSTSTALSMTAPPKIMPQDQQQGKGDVGTRQSVCCRFISSSLHASTVRRRDLGYIYHLTILVPTIFGVVLQLQLSEERGESVGGLIFTELHPKIDEVKASLPWPEWPVVRLVSCGPLPLGAVGPAGVPTGGWQSPGALRLLGVSISLSSHVPGGSCPLGPGTHCGFWHSSG